MRLIDGAMPHSLWRRDGLRLPSALLKRIDGWAGESMGQAQRLPTRRSSGAPRQRLFVQVFLSLLRSKRDKLRASSQSASSGRRSPSRA
jgi:hypothetical protein